MSPIHRSSTQPGNLQQVGSGAKQTQEGKQDKEGKKARGKTGKAGAAKGSRGIGGLPNQAGGGDMLVRPQRQERVDPDELPQDIDVDADDMGDADGPDGVVMQRGQLRTAGKMGARGATGDAGGDAGGDGGEVSGSGSGSKGEGAASSKGLKGPRGKRARGKGKKGAAGKTGGPRVRRSEGRDRTRDVEQVSVLVGQDEGGGDPVEQALAAKKRILGDEERKNAFTSAYPDDFDPNLDPPQIERLGSIQGAVHLVKLTDHWEESGFDRDAIIESTARKLLGFTRSDQVKKLLGEMGAAPIKQVYPLEVMLRILDEQPDFLPRVRRGELIENRERLAEGKRILPGHEFQVKYPPDFKLKAFALIGGGKPGYEFAPYKNGTYQMVIDTPGDWSFALSGEQKGETIIDTFTVHVSTPGRLT